MKKDKSTSVKIPTALLEDGQKFYGTDNKSEAIRKAIGEFILLPYKQQVVDTYSLHQILPNHAERTKLTQISLRLPEEYVLFIRKITDMPVQDAITAILARMLDRPLTGEIFKNSKTLNIHGSKWNPQMPEAIGHILETCNRTWEISVETCAGALGIHMNHNAQLREIVEHIVINDDDLHKINLYRCIQRYPIELKLRCMSMEISRENFQSELAKQRAAKPFSQISIENAARYLFLNLSSYRGYGKSFHAKSIKSYMERLDNIYNFYKALTDVKIHEMDIFKNIEKYQKQSKCLFIVDPPYYMTTGYDRDVRGKAKSNTGFGYSDHEKLSKLLHRAVRNNNDLIYFCRVTSTHHKDKHGVAKQSEEEMSRNDNHINGCIDDWYCRHGFYYKDIQLKNGQIERIITSFEFEGATPYGTEGC